MEKEFDFNRIGKRMPYKTPEGFLNELGNGSQCVAGGAG